MKLPNVENVIVEREKIADYLLDAQHPDNGGKAEFFERHGFRRGAWETLATAMISLAREQDVRHSTMSPHGRKYVIVGDIRTPLGGSIRLQTIWIVDNGAEAARLVTAYPKKEKATL